MSGLSDDLGVTRRRTMESRSRPGSGKRARRNGRKSHEATRGLGSVAEVILPEGVWCLTARDVYGDEFVITKRALMQLVRSAVQSAPKDHRMDIDLRHAIAIGELYREAMKLVPDAALDEFVRQEVVRRERERTRRNGAETSANGSANGASHTNGAVAD